MSDAGAGASGERRRHANALVAWLAASGVLAALAFGLSSSRDPDVEPLYEYSTFIGASIFFAFLVAVTYGISRLYGGQPGETLGLRRFRPGVLWPAGGAVVVALVIGAALEPVLHAGDEQGLTPDAWDSARAAPFFLNAVVVVCLAPFAEELFFRGLGVRVLGLLGTPIAIAGSGVFFGLAHGLLVALPPLVVFGVALAYVRMRYQSVVPAMLAHGTYNALGLGFAFLL